MNGTETEEEKMLLYSTDRKYCCTDELNIPGSWFLPNGSRLTINTRSLNIVLGNQSVRLNFTNIPELPTGIYHCEMMDRENITTHLYVGIYSEGEGTYALQNHTSHNS